MGGPPEAVARGRGFVCWTRISRHAARRPGETGRGAFGRFIWRYVRRFPRLGRVAALPPEPCVCSCPHVLFVVCVKVAVTAPVVYALGFSKQAAAGAGAVFAQVSEVALFVAARAHELELLARHTYLDVLSTTIVLLAVAPLFIHGLRRVDRRHFLEADREARRGGLVADLAQLPLLIFGRVGLLFRRPARSA